MTKTLLKSSNRFFKAVSAFVTTFLTFGMIGCGADETILSDKDVPTTQISKRLKDVGRLEIEDVPKTSANGIICTGGRSHGGPKTSK